jgi:hypothetical protein
MVRRILLICGILAALLYMGSDIMAAMRWEGYSYTAQSVSELRAIGAPTRAFLMPILTLYSLFEIAFGFGVWQTAAPYGRPKRSLRITGALLITLGVIDLSGYFFPLHLAEEANSLANTVHVLLTGATVIMILLIIGFGANADGKWFRLYSYATILILILAGASSFMYLSEISANLPTPWLGVRERINIYGYMIWWIVLAIVLLQSQRHTSQDSLAGRSDSERGGEGRTGSLTTV